MVSEFTSKNSFGVTFQKPGLKLASSVFFNKVLKLHDTYKTKVGKNFGGNFEQVDFSDSSAAANTINNWCKNNTNKKIEKLFEPSDLDRNTMAVIANAIHFKAMWKKKFEPSRTNDMDFHGINGITQVKMMHQTGHFNYGQVNSIQAQLLELPYENGDFRMLIILPFPDATLASVDEKLKTKDLSEVLKELYSTEVDVSLPRFKIESELDLEGALKELGVIDMFRDTANLSGISSDPLFVSKVKQKAFIEVNEEGTEAAAVTGISIMLMSLPPPPERFAVDRPFIVVILHSGSSVVFQGSIVEIVN
ncbi:unnamed protein product [Nesidiocoris tenuis]|uniref:Serpin domain-containing protein n=1 Tax=Nesidiocoris tenuis TaxID=355587 RepID=A0A6H5H8K0_9HEMI|nr:unnamed protein product [Nesidiocoris tenuis]